MRSVGSPICMGSQISLIKLWMLQFVMVMGVCTQIVSSRIEGKMLAKCLVCVSDVIAFKNRANSVLDRADSKPCV